MGVTFLTVSAISGIAALTVLRMRRPRYVPVHLTSAQFFLRQPRSEDQRRWRWNWRNIVSRSWLMQLLALLCLLSAAGLRNVTAEHDDVIRAWIWVDTSASMTTHQLGQTRAELARQVLEQVVSQIENSDASLREYRLSAFDLEERRLIDHTTGSGRVLDASLTPRSLGTDLSRIQDSLSRAGRPSADHPAAWSPTHTIVITDQPQPVWADGDRAAVSWLDLAARVPNQGFVHLDPDVDLLSGAVNSLLISGVAIDVPRDAVKLQIDDDPAVGVTWTDREHWQFRWNRGLNPGPHQLRLSGRDSYAFDDELLVNIPDTTKIRVRWDLPDRSWPDAVGWLTPANEPPHLIVTRFPLMEPAPADIPVLLLGKAGAGGQPSGQFVAWLQNRSPVTGGIDLLANVNVDALELTDPVDTPDEAELRHGLGRVDADNVDLHVAVADNQGGVWAAVADADESAGRIAFLPDVPDLPTPGEAPAETTRRILFLNTVQWLLTNRSPRLFELTRSGATDVQTDRPPFRLSLHTGEGDTSRSASEWPRLSLDSTAWTAAAHPVWQYPLLAALILMVAERILAAIHGRRWQ